MNVCLNPIAFAYKPRVKRMMVMGDWYWVLSMGYNSVYAPTIGQLSDYVKSREAA